MLTYFKFANWSDLTKGEKWYNVVLSALTIANTSINAWRRYKDGMTVLDQEERIGVLEDDLRNERKERERWELEANTLRSTLESRNGSPFTTSITELRRKVGQNPFVPTDAKAKVETEEDYW